MADPYSSFVNVSKGEGMAGEIADNARDVAAYITKEVLDRERLTALGVLDALASLGLKLVNDESGESTAAYYDGIRQTMVWRH